MAFPIVSVEQMRALEAGAIAAGATEDQLQDRAGRALAEVAAAALRRAPGRVVALVGSGNNGRDAFVAGRYLAGRGHQVRLWLVPRHALTSSELEELARAGIRFDVVDQLGLGELRASLDEADVAIDGLLGIGVRGPMRADLAALAQTLNQARAARSDLVVIAVDVPSGVNADDGSVPGEAVRADVTVTFGAVKAGLLRFPAAALVGRLEPRPIGLPEADLARLWTFALDRATAGSLLPARPLDAHKYRFGRVLVVAGSSRYVGAAFLCAAAAARSGCGLVGLAAPSTVKEVIAGLLPEATYPLGDVDVERDPDCAAESLVAVLPRFQALVVGPGLGVEESIERFLRTVLVANGRLERPTPVVVDADALTLLARWNGWWHQVGAASLLLTPHAGEMSRLAGADLDSTEPPWGVAARWANTWGHVVLLKGPCSAVAWPRGEVWVWPRPNPALATAGTGDVLAGLCAGFLAQGLEPPDAARLAVVVHAEAARRVVEGRRWRTLLASDLLAAIPAELADLAAA